MNAGLSLEIARKKAGVTQTQIARDFNTSRATVNRWARTGSMTLTTISMLAAYFNMKVSEFIALGE